MNPLPPSVGQLKFTISRNKSLMNKVKPSFYLNIEKNNGGKILVLYAKKMFFMKSSYYLISMEKNK
jgi:Tub family